MKTLQAHVSIKAIIFVYASTQCIRFSAVFIYQWLRFISNKWTKWRCNRTFSLSWTRPSIPRVSFLAIIVASRTEPLTQLYSTQSSMKTLSHTHTTTHTHTQLHKTLSYTLIHTRTGIQIPTGTQSIKNIYNYSDLEMHI